MKYYKKHENIDWNILQFFLNKYTCNIENFKIFRDLSLEDLEKKLHRKIEKYLWK